MRCIALSVLSAGAVVGLSDFGKAIIEEAYCHRASNFSYSNFCDLSLNSAAMELVSLQRPRVTSCLFCSSGMDLVRGFPFLSFWESYLFTILENFIVLNSMRFVALEVALS